MKLLFTIGAVPHEVLFPHSDDLTDLGQQLYQSVTKVSNSDRYRKDLESQLFDGLLNALVDNTDLNLGEVAHHSDPRPAP